MIETSLLSYSDNYRGLLSMTPPLRESRKIYLLKSILYPHRSITRIIEILKVIIFFLKILLWVPLKLDRFHTGLKQNIISEKKLYSLSVYSLKKQLWLSQSIEISLGDIKTTLENWDSFFFDKLVVIYYSKTMLQKYLISFLFLNDSYSVVNSSFFKTDI